MSIAVENQTVAGNGSSGSEVIPPPSCPSDLEQTGLNAVFLADLALKLLSIRGSALGHELGDDVGLPFRTARAGSRSCSWST